MFLVAPRYRYYITTVVDHLQSLTGIAPAVLDPAIARKDIQSLSGARTIVTTHSVRDDVAAIIGALRGSARTITLQDGIIEYRHCFQRERKSIARYRPVLTDAIAVFGRASREILLSWGNLAESIVVTGCPRFDAYFAENGFLPEQGSLLVTASNTPFSGDKDLAAFARALIDISRECEKLGVAYRVRLSEHVITNVSRAVDGENAAQFQRMLAHLGNRSDPLIEELRASNAVITTPSTVALEAMAMRRPTCLLHYDTCTVYLPSAWNIRCRDDMAPTIQEMMNPPAAKLSFQDIILRNNIRNDGSASRRVADLILRGAR